MSSPILLPRDEARLDASRAPRVVAIGAFDGVHLGHQAVVAEAAAIARARGWRSAALTFDPHPLAVVGGGAPPGLATIERRVELLANAGVDEVIVRRFDAEFASWSPERFARELLQGTLDARVALVGENFRFGARAAGDRAALAAFGAELGFEARAQGITGDEKGPFSSTRARTAVAGGDVVEAARILGRRHATSGVVEHGAKLGRTLGFPTANLGGVPELAPKDGIYAVVVDEVTRDAHGRVQARALGVGAMSIGMRPTIHGAAGRTHEVYLLDFDRDLYGSTLRVHYVARLRDELKLESLAALKARIARDVAETRTATAGVAPGPGGAYG